MPSPWVRRIHSSKFFGFAVAMVFATLASIRPVRHVICIMEYQQHQLLSQFSI